MESATASPSPVPRYAAALSLTEISVGSLIHAFHLPLGGHVLSLNQALVLTFSTRGARDRRACLQASASVSNVAAALKSLSPAGKKLSPMLAISVQGALFALGTAVGGPTRAGVALGAVLLSLWAFVHPLAVGYLVFGSPLIEGLLKLWQALASALHIDPNSGLHWLLAVVAFKALLAAALALKAWGAPVTIEQRYLERLERQTLGTTTDARGRASVGRTLVSFPFLISLVISVGFFVFDRSPSLAQATLYALRIFAMAALLLWLGRTRAFSRFLGRFPSVRAARAQLDARSRS